MNEKLARLIFDFQEKILVALKIMHRSGIPMPLSCNHWIELDIPISGELGKVRISRSFLPKLTR